MKVKGSIYSDNRFFYGCLEFDAGSIIDIVEGSSPAKFDAEGIILPLLSNCHTHVGDSALRGKIDAGITLEELVKPPDGLKHQLLKKQTDRSMVEAMSAAIEEMKVSGVGRFIDFREGGVAGLKLFNEASRIRPYPKSLVLSRPAGICYSEPEVELRLANSDGIGISAISDWPLDELLSLSSHVKRRKKLFALHASEGRREELSEVLKLEPDFLVHMSKASDKDLEGCKRARIPIVVCPRSNSRFGIPLDLSKMIDIGVDVCIGTDNAMLHDLSLIQELRCAFSLESNGRALEPAEVLKLAVENPRKVLYDAGVHTLAAGSPCEFMVVKTGKASSPERLLTAGKDPEVALVSIGTKVWKSGEWKR